MLHLPIAATKAGPSTSSITAHTHIPQEIRIATADLLAAVHLSHGKAQSPVNWGIDMRGALGGLALAMNDLVADAWAEGEPLMG